MTCDLEWPWTTLCLKLDIINVNTVRIIWVHDWWASCQVSSILNYSRQQLIVTLNWPSDDLGLNAIVERDFYVKCRPVQLWLISEDKKHTRTDAWPSCILWSILSSWPSRSFVSFFIYNLIVMSLISLRLSWCGSTRTLKRETASRAWMELLHFMVVQQFRVFW